MTGSDISINLIPERRQAVARAAEALLRWLGAGRVTLRISDPSTGDTNSQLGITPPTAEDIVITPGMLRSIAPGPDGKRRWEVLLSARALRAAAEPYGVTDLTAWLTSSQGVVYYDMLLPITSVISTAFADGEYLYLAIATE